MIWSRRSVRRARGARTPAPKRSAKIWRPHRTASHRNRRTRISSSTRRPLSGRSFARRQYRALDPLREHPTVRTWAFANGGSGSDNNKIAFDCNTIDDQSHRNQAGWPKSLLHHTDSFWKPASEQPLPAGDVSQSRICDASQNASSQRKLEPRPARGGSLGQTSGAVVRTLSVRTHVAQPRPLGARRKQRTRLIGPQGHPMIRREGEQARAAICPERL
jgi:hypothetical protein